MKFPRGFCHLSVLALSFAGFSTFGVGFRIPNQDPEAVARGNAFVATADNPSALYYNPAGITQLTNQTIEFGLYSTVVRSYYESPSGSKSKTDLELQGVPEIYYVKKLNDLPISIGLAVYVPYGLGLQWPENTGFRTVAVEGRLQYATVQPTIAWKINDTISVSAAPTLNRGDVTLRQGIAIPGDQFEFKGHDYAFGCVLGVLVSPSPEWSIGAAYHSETTMDFHGHSIARPYAPAEPTTASVPFPQFIAGGVSYRPTKNWNFEVDIDWTDWDVLKTVTFEKKSGPTPVPFNWQSSFFYEFGATRALPNNFFLNFGYFYSENSTTDKSFNPVVPDTDLHIGSIGLSRRTGKWDWAFTYQLIHGPDRVISNGGVSDGSYHFFNHALVASISRHW